MSGAQPRHWGWHQLTERSARQLVERAGIRPGDLVVDVGAGHGALTAPLVNAGARVIAVELHAARAAHLRDAFRGRAVTVVRADAADLRLPRRPFRVVANPPFALTTALIKRLLANGSRLVTADLVVPRHVALRWSGDGAPAHSRWGRHFVARVSGSLPRSAFEPPPPCSTAILRIEVRAR